MFKSFENPLCPVGPPVDTLGLVWSPAKCKVPTLTKARLQCLLSADENRRGKKTTTVHMIGDSTTRYLHHHVLTVLDGWSNFTYWSHRGSKNADSTRITDHPSLSVSMTFTAGPPTVSLLLQRPLSDYVYFALAEAWLEESLRTSKRGPAAVPGVEARVRAIVVKFLAALGIPRAASPTMQNGVCVGLVTVQLQSVQASDHHSHPRGFTIDARLRRPFSRALSRFGPFSRHGDAAGRHS